MSGTRIFLVDNGSYEPTATLALRGLAQEVSKLIGQEVRPVSTMHSTKIDPTLLGGVPAVIFEGAVQQAKLDGIDEIVVIPLFIGPSRAITEYLPKVFADAQPGKMKLLIREPIFGDGGAELTTMLVDNLKSTGWTKGSGTVLLCDHGSPIREVTVCRNSLATQLRNQLGLEDGELIGCSMERREGPEYAFNEPLLQDALHLTKLKGNTVILMLFLLPGRHAGTDGDVATIAKEHAPADIRWKISPLLGTHPLLPQVLAARFADKRLELSAKQETTLIVLLALFLPITLGYILPTSIGQSSSGRTLVSILAGITLWAIVFFYFRSKRRK
jgi:sirohydrochlorin ferrochelatase